MGKTGDCLMSNGDTALAPAPDPGVVSAEIPKPPEAGTLQVTTDPSPLSVQVFDTRGHHVAQGVSPATFTLPPGLYAVCAKRPNAPDLVMLGRVVSKGERPIRLLDRDPKFAELASSTFFGFVDTYYYKVQPIPSYKAQPIRRATQETIIEPSAVKPFWVRFQRLTDWETSHLEPTVSFSSERIHDRAVLSITNPVPGVVFAQIAGATGPVLNVALPPAGVRPSQCQLVVGFDTDGPQAFVRLSTDWANAAMQYMSKGYYDEAKDLVEAGKARSDDRPSVFQRMVNHIGRRFDDPSAALVPRYLALRLGEDTILSTIGDSVLDVLQPKIPDGRIISAESAARRQEYEVSASHLNAIPAGTLPLFTEGFSLLVHRLRELRNLEPDAPAKGARSAAELGKLKILMRTLSKWALHINLNCPTLTFKGINPAAPSRSAELAAPAASDGWKAGISQK